MSARTIWPTSKVKQVMALRPPDPEQPPAVVIDLWYRALPEADRWPTKYQASKLTGVPPSTIWDWWTGALPGVKGRPRYKNHRQNQCVKGHWLRNKNVYRRSDGTRECNICRREATRKHRYVSQHLFHPVYNPDMALAPLHNLWVPCVDVVALVEESYTNTEVLAIFGAQSSAYNRWMEMTSGRKKWLRFDAADRILSELALNPVSLEREPTYSTTVPKGDPE